MAPQTHSLHGYPYRLLMIDQPEIRLIRVKPTSHKPASLINTDILCCEFMHAVRWRCRPYIALSYTWGRDIDQVPLYIEDRQYQVNPTVEAALRQLQANNSDVYVWVDQICINQQDDIEKNHQVQQMMEIYSEAESVMAWLGITADGSDRLLKHVGRIGQFIWAGEYQRVFAPHQSREAQEAIGLVFRSLCERDYWKRLWIMQEYAVANRLRIACGDVMVWDWQLQAVLVFMNRVSLNSQEILPGDYDHGIEAVSQGMVRAYRNPATSFMEGVVTRRDRSGISQRERRSSVPCPYHHVGP